ncbi:NTP transferase domain-containing protein [Acidocella sp. MX-AZ03]|uniref:nucleotidyltransferase family protein n=1 Tax=Acidocella sp. MX-AZ03 TaxID=2697363 RepID=UPI0022DE498E|nr:NTP transferase domain-containing protein [Acidocella sp. MX-AZ03]WBO59295.1 NTP transferase domain-containing protein [Acidocella sp. MX-AZ03]
MRFAVLVLAAGASRRMGAQNKLLLALASGQSILRTVLERAVAAQIGPVLLVTGHEAARVAGEAEGLAVQCVHAAEHEEGMAASLRAGIAAVPEDCAGAVVCLGDMPFVSSAVLRELAGRSRRRSILCSRCLKGGQAIRCCGAGRILAR